ncbi:hypothetical protein AJ80_08563 [Polytolypa hystricis UAMH7299]|uniref:Phytanoyl-CoA dioxygenase n=1 Tax=Polytolypa hystricis (strain UAMH7299) TaxID=1447883 RepID=A0A2B7X6C5_POLH7|nr:hypothetical protein AJ80_08563 [Polytolypa hystricis UAMH7299]
MTDNQDHTLTQDQIDFFLEHGYLKLKNCFSREAAAEWTKDVWKRLGYSPDDPSTWVRERINMPWHRREDVKTFSPKAWSAICQLLGGEDQVNINNGAHGSKWADGFIVNLGPPEGDTTWVEPRDLDNWHVDGDFFIHFLDSPEQGLLITPLWSDVLEHGGGTMICPEAIEHVAKHLYDHPGGVTPRMVPRGQESSSQHNGLSWFIELAKKCSNFVEVTGEVGDVFLMHPLMLHSASRNALRIPRLITNPPVTANEPFNFNRADGAYSIVEQKTLRALGRPEGLGDWKIVGERAEVVPERVRIQAQMKELELKRLQGEKVDLSLGNEWDKAPDKKAAVA